MTDLHCHILPGIDDGARDVATSLELLKIEKESGVDHIIFTPHFYCEEESVEDFLEKRNAAYDCLMTALLDNPYGVSAEDFEFKLGAEVKFSPMLSQIDPTKLCYTDTSYMLIELSFSRRPQFLSDVIYDIRSAGITPILAHVERYPYLLENMEEIYDMVCSGMVIQTNAKTLIDGDKQTAMLMKMIDCNLVHVVSSDTHSVHRRPPDLANGISAVHSKLGDDTAERLVSNGDQIFYNDDIACLEPRIPKRIFGRWF